MPNKELRNMAVISDPQINALTTYNNVIGKDCEILQECFRNMDVEAIAVCGDITENSLKEEWDSFFDAFSNKCPMKELYLVPGNMDSGHNTLDKKAFLENYRRCNYTDREIDDLYFAYEKDNCILVGLCPEPDKNGIITDSQLEVLNYALHTAANRNIPAFVFSHLQVADTIHIDWYAAMSAEDSKNVKKLLEKYNGKVIFFSGHTHSGLIKKTGGSVIKVNNVTYVSTPSITKPNVDNPLIDNNSVGTGYMVELYNESVRIRGYDFMDQIWLKDFEWIV